MIIKQVNINNDDESPKTPKLFINIIPKRKL